MEAFGCLCERRALPFCVPSTEEELTFRSNAQSRDMIRESARAENEKGGLILVSLLIDCTL